ncbi:transcriptional regulator NrdR [Candidatus Woesearchaeota archaeon]|nr:transcriptional regulator NrdR [Candidatus Woesearchaeota archaeon]
MLCPYCSHDETKVLETRETSVEETRRRRECLKCEKRFTTYERVELKPILVIKKDGRREEFDRQKIIRGLLRSSEKRPVSLMDIEKLVDNVEYKIRSLGLQEVKSTKVGQLVMNRLKKLDSIAYIRFASVYRDFEDIESFQDEIERLTERVIEENLKK